MKAELGKNSERASTHQKQEQVVDENKRPSKIFGAVVDETISLDLLSPGS